MDKEKHIPGRGNTGKSIKPNSVIVTQRLLGGENTVESQLWVVTVKNEGLVDAIGVQLNATLC